MIEASLKFSCILNNEEVYAEPLKLYFQLKPVIDYVELTDSVLRTPPFHYDYDFKVQCRGTETLRVAVEEEYSPILRPQYFKNPDIVYGTIEGVNRAFWSWIDFEAQNKYGKTTYTIPLPPHSDFNTDDSKVNDMNVLSSSTVEVITLSGVSLGEYSKNDFDPLRALSKGVYIFIFKDNNQVVKIEKKIIK